MTAPARKTRQRTSITRMAHFIILVLATAGGGACSAYSYILARHGPVEDWTAWILPLSGVMLIILVDAVILRSMRIAQGVEQIVKERTERLAASEQRYRAIAENTSDWIWEVDANGVFRACTGDLKTTLGYEEHELLGRTPFDLMPPDESSRVRAIFENHPELQSSFHDLEHWVIAKDGSRVWIHSDALPVFRQDGGVRGFVAVSKDVTRRKMADQEAAQRQEKLEKLVKEKTASLQESNESLQREITYRRQAEANVREKEQQLRDIADRVPGLVFQFYARPGADYGFHYISRGGSRIFGIEEDSNDRYGQFVAHIHEDDREAFVNAVHKAVHEATVMDFNGRFVRPDGRLLWFRTTATLEKRDEEIILNGLILDMTEVKEAEAQAREKEQLLNATLEATADGIQVVDAQGHLLYFNARFAEMWNIPAELLESEQREGLAAHMRARIREIERLYISSDTGLDTLQFPNGRLLERYTHPLTREGEAVGRVLSFRDVTERNRAERSLRESEERFRTLVERAADAVLLVALDGTVLSANEQACRSLGYSGEELFGMKVSDFEDYSMKDAERYALWQDMDPGDTYTREGVHRRKDGTTFPVEVRLGRLEINGQPAILGLARDVTERKQAEAELAEAHKKLVATARQAGMAEVASGVLHNVGNVLNSVGVTTDAVRRRIERAPLQDFAEIMSLLSDHASDLGTFITQDRRGREIPAFLRDLADHLIAERQASLDDLSELREHVQHISDIVALQQTHSVPGGLTELSRLERLAEEALQICGRSIERSGIEVLREYQPVPGVLVDTHKVMQILVNLIRNAQDALASCAHADKRIILRVYLDPKGQACVEVEDNGTGISQENQNLLFTHGFTTKEKGHGLGLHSGALAAQDMGGSLSARSDGEGKGAVFSLEIPLRVEGEIDAQS